MQIGDLVIYEDDVTTLGLIVGFDEENDPFVNWLKSGDRSGINYSGDDDPAETDERPLKDSIYYADDIKVVSAV